MDLLESMPKFQWGQIYHSPAVPEHGGAQQAAAHSVQDSGRLEEIAVPCLPKGGDIVTLRHLDGM